MWPLHVVMSIKMGTYVYRCMDNEDPLRTFKGMKHVALGFRVQPGNQSGSCVAVAHPTGMQSRLLDSGSILQFYAGSDES